MHITRKTYNVKPVSVGIGEVKMVLWMRSISACTAAISMVANVALYGTYGFSGTAVSTGDDAEQRVKAHVRSPERGRKGTRYKRAAALVPKHELVEPVHHVVPTRNEVDDDSCLSARSERRERRKRMSNNQVEGHHLGRRAEVVDPPKNKFFAGSAVDIGGREHSLRVHHSKSHGVERSILVVFDLLTSEARHHLAAQPRTNRSDGLFVAREERHQRRRQAIGRHRDRHSDRAGKFHRVAHTCYTECVIKRFLSSTK